MTKYYDFRNQINEDDFNEIINIFNSNGVVIFPTETVYGIGGNAFSNEVIDRVYDIKKRPKNKCINIMVGKKEQIYEYAIVGSKEKQIIEKYMPGEITIILNKKDKLNSYAFENSTIGIRIPNNNIMLKILSELPFPIVATSANISGEENYDFEKIKKQFDGKVDAIIKGEMGSNLASTIVKVVDNNIEILRQGKVVIDSEMIK